MSHERRRGHSVGRQLRALSRLLLVWGFIALTIAIVRVQGGDTDNELSQPLLDDAAWYDGAIADFNLAAWAASAAIAFVGGWVAFQTGRPSAGRFLAVGGAVSTWLLADSMLLLHADALPSAGLPVALAALIVIVPVLAWILRFRSEVRRTRWMMLGCAIFALEVAIFFGAYWTIAQDATVVDDGATFLAACAWGLYFTLTTRDIVRSTVRTAMERDAEPVAEPV